MTLLSMSTAVTLISAEDGTDYSQNEASSESNNAQDDRWHAEGVRTQEYHRRKRSGHST